MNTTTRERQCIKALIADLEALYRTIAMGEKPEVSRAAFRRLRDAHEVIAKGE